MPTVNAPSTTSARMDSIALARQDLLGERKQLDSLVPPWVARSWQRCLLSGMAPNRAAEFELISQTHSRQTSEGNSHLVQTAKPLLENLGRAIANTGYFVILTNQHGVVVDVNGPIDRSDRRADLITRIGTDLSEQRVGTTAIGTALTEQQPVWLHRGEHFFSNTSAYSCAGAPVFGPAGDCVGMLDLTGIEAMERPELSHLVTQVAGKIGNALVLAQSHSLLLRLNWPGNALGTDADGMLCLDADGWVTGANRVARHMVSGLQTSARVHASDLFGLPLQMLFDAARRSHNTLDLPLWSGLSLSAMAVQPAFENMPARFDKGHVLAGGIGLKDMETALIHQAVEQARGNVAQAALALGISRATVYRKLGARQRQ
ncbi:histidine kinase [Rhodoferax lacus]|uniref:Histidine kinase n=1 Tax=Rhodoferax lacus TaxID=2184758 RepID=A0A3E1RFF2_9BURK|nr:helix-turn-helix domain-containing protein [Rhodoferax lacus]RFO98097.1 histidine kinase [Rhodoferax lacus]